MASIRITQFGGLMPEVHGKLIAETQAQIAHNCLLLDGKLRPQAEWVRVHSVALSPSDTLRYHLAYSEVQGRALPYALNKNPIPLEGPPFATGRVVGGVGTQLGIAYLGGGEALPVELPDIRYPASGASVTYTRSYDSIKPINRIYAASYVREYDGRREEGPLAILANQTPTDIVYEGDLVSITMSTNTNDPAGGRLYVRIYRTITGLDTGTAATNELDTNWHLVAEMPATGTLQYTDGASATALPLDMAYSTQFAPLATDPDYFGLTESGWFVAASRNGTIQVSERYMHHAWPVENEFRLPVGIVDMVVSGDNVFFGTERNPYMMALSAGDKAMQARIDPYREDVPCRPGSMTATASGAMYASGQGLVALSRDGMQLITRELTNAGSVFATRKRPIPGAEGNKLETLEVSIGNTGFGYYHMGKYYAFCFDWAMPTAGSSGE